jgi:amino acid permease
MTIGGWIFLVLSLAFVWALTVWCFYRVFTAPKETTKPPDSLGG